MASMTEESVADHIGRMTACLTRFVIGFIRYVGGVLYRGVKGLYRLLFGSSFKMLLTVSTSMCIGVVTWYARLTAKAGMQPFSWTDVNAAFSAAFNMQGQSLLDIAKSFKARFEKFDTNAANTVAARLGNVMHGVMQSFGEGFNTVFVAIRNGVTGLFATVTSIDLAKHIKHLMSMPGKAMSDVLTLEMNTLVTSEPVRNAFQFVPGKLAGLVENIAAILELEPKSVTDILRNNPVVVVIINLALLVGGVVLARRLYVSYFGACNTRKYSATKVREEPNPFRDADWDEEAKQLLAGDEPET